MSKPKSITVTLSFSNHEPHIIGHLQIDTEHFEIAGIRRSEICAEIIRKVETPQSQMDFFDENSSRSGDRKRNII